MRGLYVVGAGGHGAVVAELAVAAGWTIEGFVDEDPVLLGSRVLEWAVLGGLDAVPAGAQVALGIGDNSVRAGLIERAAEMQWQLPILTHPSAVVSHSAELGPGCVLVAQAVVNARARIGAGCILNTACSVDHDCELGDVVHIAPGSRLAGGVKAGRGTIIGIGSCVRPYTSIGANCTIGAGSVVVCDLPDGCTAFGNPARVRHKNTGAIADVS